MKIQSYGKLIREVGCISECTFIQYLYFHFIIQLPFSEIQGPATGFWVEMKLEEFYLRQHVHIFISLCLYGIIEFIHFLILLQFWVHNQHTFNINVFKIIAHFTVFLAWMSFFRGPVWTDLLYNSWKCEQTDWKL